MPGALTTSQANFAQTPECVTAQNMTLHGPPGFTSSPYHSVINKRSKTLILAIRSPSQYISNYKSGRTWEVTDRTGDRLLKSTALAHVFAIIYFPLRQFWVGRTAGHLTSPFVPFELFGHQLVCLVLWIATVSYIGIHTPANLSFIFCCFIVVILVFLRTHCRRIKRRAKK